MVKKKSQFENFIKGGLTVLISVLIIFTITKAAPPTSPYSPGDTLSPACAPGDANCKVALTNGSVLFSNGINLFTQDNSNFYWDNANKRLGIGTATPAYTLDISGNIRATGNLIVAGQTIGGNFSVEGSAILGDASSDTITFNAAALSVPNNFNIDSATLYIDSANNNVGIGTASPAQKLHVEGQCVTGDTLLPIIQQENFQFSIFNFQSNSNDLIFKQIKDIKGGEYVLSLNEKTGIIEPAKIKGLLDMGVQPIYEIETEDGKKIRTTGNHPYLAKDYSTQKVFSSSKIINLPEIFSAVNLESKFFKATDKLKNVGGKTFKRMMPEYSEGEKTLVLEKSPSCVKMIRDSFLAESANSKSLNPFSTNFTSCPHCMSSFAKRNFTFSSTKNLIKLFAQHFNSAFFSCAGGAGESGMDMPDSESGIIFEDFRNCFASRQHIQNKPDHNSSSFESKLSMADCRVGDDVFIDNDNHENDVNDYYDNNYSKDNNGLSNAKWTEVYNLSEGDEIAVADNNLEGIKFVKIAKIKILPAEQVYDIEVEGTHNFVANGIIAHNTYINSTDTAANVKGLQIAQSGAVSGTGYGLYVDKTGAGTTNVGGYFSASGAITNNYGLIVANGNVGIGQTAPTAYLHLKAGTATASTAPLKFTSGVLNTTPEAGAVEFLADAFYGTITTGAARKTFAFLESPTFTGTVTIPTPFTLGATSVTATGTQLNYLNAAGGTTGTASTNLVFSTSPTLITPALGTPSALVLTNATGLPAAAVLAGTFGTGAYVMDTTLTVPAIIGGTGASGTLTLQSTSNATKGKILFGTSAYDEVNNWMGIGTIIPRKKLDVLDASAAQLRLTYSDNSVYSDFTLDTNGNLTINPAKNVYLTHNASTGSNLWVCEGPACPGAGTSMGSTGGNLTVEGKIYGGTRCPADMVYVPGDQPFCIDKFEAYNVGGTVVNDTCTNGSQAEVDANTTIAIAGSATGQVPLASLNWCAAKKACQNAGKHLCTNQEWFQSCNYKGGQWNITAEETAETMSCNTASEGTPSNTGNNPSCVTQEGAYDMIGNVWEWVDKVVTADPTNGLATSNYVTGYDFATGLPTSVGLTAAAYGNDYFWAYNGAGAARAAIRGGDWNDGANDGCFPLALSNAPSAVYTDVGFRCCQ